MTRPKSLLDQVAIEKVVSEGIQQPGPAVPDAKVQTKPVAPGQPSLLARLAQDYGPQATPRQPVVSSGAVANPQTAIHDVSAPAVPKQPVVSPGATANPRTAIPDVPVQAWVTTPERFLGQLATPKIAEAIAGVPANVREKQATVGQAAPTPRSQVTVVVPPAFPMDVQKAFADVDDVMRTNDAVRPIQKRDITPSTFDLKLESTEELVARSYQSLEGGSASTDRWHL